MVQLETAIKAEGEGEVEGGTVAKAQKQEVAKGLAQLTKSQQKQANKATRGRPAKLRMTTQRSGQGLSSAGSAIKLSTPSARS
jgi:hypothetical protein